MTNQAPKFRALHTASKLLILPNAWDAGSARVFEDLGAPAIATTSAGVCWALGYSDGAKIPAKAMAKLATDILRVIRVPLSVDVENGYSSDPKEVAENLKPLLDAGVAGINIEDGQDAPDVLVAKLEKIRAAASKMKVDFFINARTDVYLEELVVEGKRVDETVARAARYKEAGADGLFVPALKDTDAIKTIASRVKMPLNVMAWPGLPLAKELKALGASRLSSGSGIPQVLWQHAAILAKDFLETGNSKPMSENYMAHAKLQGLFA